MNEAAKIRKELKAAGWNSRQVSVRTSQGTGSVNVWIKDATIPISKVEEIALKHRRVSYCERSHDVLSGGNTFVFVEYCRGVLDAMAAPIIEALGASEPGSAVVVADGIKVWRCTNDRHMCWVQAGNECATPTHGIEYAAKRAVIECVEAGTTPEIAVKEEEPGQIEMMAMLVA